MDIQGFLQASRLIISSMKSGTMGVCTAQNGNALQSAAIVQGVVYSGCHQTAVPEVTDLFMFDSCRISHHQHLRIARHTQDYELTVFPFACVLWCVAFPPMP